MATLPMRAPHSLQIRPLAGLGHVVSVIVAAIEVFSEAQRQARAAHARLPFADW